MDQSFVERNRASTERIRLLAAGLSDAQMQTPVGKHWTVAIVFAHLAFWDRRVMYVLDKTEQDGVLFIPEIDIFVNDLSLPLWAAIPPREAARIAIETAGTLDRRLEAFPAALLEEIYTYNKRWVDRSLHRGEHLDQTFDPMGLEAPLVFVKLRARNTALLACGGDITQNFGQLEHAQSLLRNFDLRCK